METHTPTTGVAEPNTKHFNRLLRGRLLAYKERREAEGKFSLGDLARELDSNDSAVSRYLNGTPTGDVETLEQVIADVLESESRRRKQTHALFDNAISRAVAGNITLIRDTNDVGVIHGDAGIGKSSGAELYVRKHPAAKMITIIPEENRKSHILQKLLAGKIIRKPKHGRKPSRVEKVIERYRGSNIPLIIDNAHLCAVQALAFLIYFNDETGVPVILMGNSDELLGKLKNHDQLYSRIGSCWEVKLEQPSADGKKAVDCTVEITRRLLREMDPTCEEELLPLATVVAAEKGHFRSLRKQVALAREFRKGTGLSWEAAFRAAHRKLVRNYELPTWEIEPGTTKRGVRR